MDGANGSGAATVRESSAAVSSPFGPASASHEREPRRVLVVHNYYQHRGGEDEVFAAETRLLERHGHAVERFTVHNDHVASVGGIRLAVGAVWNRASYRSLLAICTRFKPDVVHFHNTLPLVSPAGYYAARASGAAVVQTLHNYRLVCPGGLLFRNGKPCEACVGRTIPAMGVIHRCYRKSLAASATVGAVTVAHRLGRTWHRMVDAYVALTEFARSRFVAGGVPGDKIIVKPNFVDPDPGVGAHDGDFALFVGRLVPEKGVATLARAWTKANVGLTLRIAGDGPLRQAGDGGSIEWLGRKDRATITSLMRDARLLVMPSESYETFGLAIVEAFATALPVIASRIGAAGELVTDGETGLQFTPGNVAELTERIRWALAHPQAMADMGVRGRSVFEARYSAERNYALLLAIYRTALSVAPRRG